MSDLSRAFIFLSLSFLIDLAIATTFFFFFLGTVYQGNNCILNPTKRKCTLGSCADSESPDAQSDQGLRCPQTLDTIECFNGEQMPDCGFAHVQDDVNLHILCMFKGAFSLDAVLLVIAFTVAAATNAVPFLKHVSFFKVIGLTGHRPRFQIWFRNK